MRQALIDQLGIGGWQILALVVDTSVLFWVFTVMMSYFGQQMRARLTVTTFTLMAVVGSVTARAMLGPTPTMTAGIIVLVVLFVWEGLYRLIGRHLPKRWLPTRSARVVLRDGEIDHDALRAAQVRQSDLMVRLRHAGVTRLADVAYAIVERDGSVTIVRAGQSVDDALLEDVAGL